jgi:C4-type Zn-finger protein
VRRHPYPLDPRHSQSQGLHEKLTEGMLYEVEGILEREVEQEVEREIESQAEQEAEQEIAREMAMVEHFSRHHTYAHVGL